MAEAFGIAWHELVSLDFRCGSRPDEDGPPAPGLLSGVKRTYLSKAQTSAQSLDQPSHRAHHRVGGGAGRRIGRVRSANQTGLPRQSGPPPLPG